MKMSAVILALASLGLLWFGVTRHVSLADAPTPDFGPEKIVSTGSSSQDPSVAVSGDSVYVAWWDFVIGSILDVPDGLNHGLPILCP
jgi:hypothetical protein